MKARRDGPESRDAQFGVVSHYSMFKRALIVLVDSHRRRSGSWHHPGDLSGAGRWRLPLTADRRLHRIGADRRGCVSVCAVAPHRRQEISDLRWSHVSHPNGRFRVHLRAFRVWSVVGRSGVRLQSFSGWLPFDRDSGADALAADCGTDAGPVLSARSNFPLPPHRSHGRSSYRSNRPVPSHSGHDCSGDGSGAFM